MRVLTISLSCWLICVITTGLARGDEKPLPVPSTAVKKVEPAPDTQLGSDKPITPLITPETKPGTPGTSQTPPSPPAIQVPVHVVKFPADPAQVAKWIVELNDDKYEVREAATVKLSSAGAVAVEPLARACEGSDLEVASRALRALRALYIHIDEEVYGPAEAALTRLAASSNRGVARRASSSIAQPVAIQQKRVLKRIESLGGIITYQMTPNGIATGQFGEPMVLDIRLDESWKGGDAGLNNLRKLAYLSKLYIIEGSNVTAAAVDSLHTDLPNLAVERRGRALLGVEGSTADGLCLIAGVSENGAAAKAGIKPGDVIVKYADSELKGFQDLIEITKKKKAGDKIAVEVLRQDATGAKIERIKIEVTLGGWRSSGTGPVRRNRD